MVRVRVNGKNAIFTLKSRKACYLYLLCCLLCIQSERLRNTDSEGSNIKDVDILGDLRGIHNINW